MSSREHRTNRPSRAMPSSRSDRPGNIGSSWAMTRNHGPPDSSPCDTMARAAGVASTSASPSNRKTVVGVAWPKIVGLACGVRAENAEIANRLDSETSTAVITRPKAKVRSTSIASSRSLTLDRRYSADPIGHKVNETLIWKESTICLQLCNSKGCGFRSRTAGSARWSCRQGPATPRSARPPRPRRRCGQGVPRAKGTDRRNWRRSGPPPNVPAASWQ